MVFLRFLRRLALTVLALAVTAAVLCGYALAIVATRAVPTLPAAPANIPVPETAAFDWTRPSSVAVGTLGGGLKATAGDTGPRATASLAKVITVLVVASIHPLGATEDGPSITMTSADVARIGAVQAKGGVAYPVASGQVWTQRQLLAAILLVSANNLADGYAVWGFGSMDAYRAAGMAWLRDHHLTHTVIGSDACGLDPATTSTTADLFELGRLFEADPALSAIVDATSATGPGGVAIEGHDPLVTHDGYVGIKTGTLSVAGYCLIVANRQVIGDQTVIVIGVVLGETDNDARYQAGRDLVNWALANLVPAGVAAGQPYGYVTTPEGALLPIVAQHGIDGVRWRDEPITVTLDLPATGFTMPLVDGTPLGEVGVLGQTVPLVVVGDVARPDLEWRLGHLRQLAW